MCTGRVCTASSNLQACCEAGSPAGQEAATAIWVLPACWYLCAPPPHLQCGTESPDKCLDHPKNNRSNTSMFPKFPPFIASMQVLHAKANKGREPGSTSVPPGSTALGWSWTFTSSLYVGFVPSPIATNPRELQSLPIWTSWMVSAKFGTAQKASYTSFIKPHVHRSERPGS